ncbi:MAG: hypothetical protein NTZ55_05070 [Candidatus Roizmanbacteria bacterium]|nr:hypothetical protein [Candidatus Roizmanbacteria bacterium]
MGVQLKNLTEEELILQKALIMRGVKVDLHYNDGHKCVDLFLPEANIDIEVDGMYHLTKAKQILSDFKREYWSQKEGRHTLHILNIALEKNLDLIADAIKEVTCELKVLLKLEKLIKETIASPRKLQTKRSTPLSIDLYKKKGLIFDRKLNNQ